VPTPAPRQRQTLEIELEDAGSTSWLASLLATLGSQNGNAFMRFVARTTGSADQPRRVVLRAGPFPRLRSIPDDVPPHESYCPGMTATLDDLRQRLEKDGWEPVGHGKHAWSYRYAKDAGEPE
jgi:hypothetical protein